MLARNKIAIVLVGAGIAVATAYHFGTADAMVARLLRQQLTRYVRAPASFESASFSFLHGIEVRGLVVLDPDDPLGTPLVAADRAHVNYTFDALGYGPHLTTVEIERPRVRLERTADGSLPFLHAFNPPEAPNAAVPQPLVNLIHGEVTFADPSIVAGEPLALHELTITAAPAGSRATTWARGTVVLRATSDVLGPIELEARVGDAGDSAAVALELPRIVVDPALPGRFVGITARRIAEMAPSGEVAAHIDARLAEGKDFDAEATIDVKDLAVRATLPEDRPGEAPPKPFPVTGINGRLHYAADRLDTADLVFVALGGGFSIEATLDGVTKAAPRIDARLVLRDLPVDMAFRDFVPQVAREVLEAYDVRCDLTATITARGELSSPDVTVAARLARGHVRYDGHPDADGVRRGFPYAADDVVGEATFAGTTLDVAATGRHGPAQLTVKVNVEFPPGKRPIPDVRVEALEVPADEDVRRAMGENVNDWFDKWGPSGIAKRVTVHVFNVPEIDGAHEPTEVTVELDGRASVKPWVVPVRLDGVVGRLEVLCPVEDGRRIGLVRLVDASARAEGFDAKVVGDIRDDGSGSREDLHIEAETEDASDGFRRALDASPVVPDTVKAALAKLGASGPLGAKAHVKRNADGTRGDEVFVKLRGAAVQGWGDIPLAAKDLTGELDLVGDTLTFRDVAGHLVLDDFSPAVKLSGRLLDVSKQPQFDWHVEAPDLPLGESLRTALGPLAAKARRFWEDFHPVGNAKADCVLDLRPDSNPTPFEITFSRIRGALKPLGLELDNDDGTFHFDGRHATIVGLESAIGAAAVRIDYADYDVAKGGLELRAGVRGLHFPEDLEGPLSAKAVAEIVDAAPGRTVHASSIHLVYDADRRALEISGAMSVRPRQRRGVPSPGWAPEGLLDLGRLVFWLPEDGPVSFEGEARVDEFSLNAGLAVDSLSGPLKFAGSFAEPSTFDVLAESASFHVEQYPLTDATLKLTLTRRGPRVELIGAKFMGGDLVGRVGPGDETVAYRGSFQIHGAELEQFLTFRGTPQKEVASGRVDADIRFTNATGAREDLRGTVEARVRDGQLAPIPAIAAISSVTKLMSVATMGATGSGMFTDAKASANLEGEWLDLVDLELSGPGAVVEGGRGKIGLDGRLDLAVYPRLDLDLPLLDWIVAQVQAPLPRRIHVTGTLRNPQTRWEFVPSGGIDLRREPQPAGDVQAPAREPW